MGGQVWPADRDTDMSDAQPMIVGVYSRREARALASVLIGELWPWPGSNPEFRGAESRVEALLTEYDTRVLPQEGSGLTARQFILWTQAVGQVLLIQHLKRFDPPPPGVDGREQMKQALWMLLSSRRSSPVRVALDEAHAAVEAARPRGLSLFSRSRSERHMRSALPQVANARRHLAQACQTFLDADG